jgi:hypothetical protein
LKNIIVKKNLREVEAQFPESEVVRAGQARYAMGRHDTLQAKSYIDLYKSILERNDFYPDPLIMAHTANLYAEAGAYEKAVSI